MLVSKLGANADKRNPDENTTPETAIAVLQPNRSARVLENGPEIFKGIIINTNT